MTNLEKIRSLDDKFFTEFLYDVLTHNPDLSNELSYSSNIHYSEDRLTEWLNKKYDSSKYDLDL